MFFYIKTWGCQMNSYDSSRIQEILEDNGHVYTESPADADIAILNTCHIREKATEKVLSDIGRLRKIKARRNKIGKDLIICVAGCVAQAEGEEIMRILPDVSLAFGPQVIHRLPEMLNRVINKERICDTDFPAEDKFDYLINNTVGSSRIHSSSAFVTIQEGCDKFCTYCVVPYTRGSEYSRPLWQIIDEVSLLVKNGAKEIILLGQNVNAYHGLDNTNREVTLGELIRHVAQIDGVSSIKYTTSYPAEVDSDLINAHRDVSKLSPFLHLPMQSGSNKILKKMNRKHTQESYIDLYNALKIAQPEIVLSSDFIVGFPGETEEDFEDTLSVVKKVGFIQSFCFSYSPRPGTPAATYKDQVPDEVKSARLKRLQIALAQEQAKFNDKSVGKKFPLLILGSVNKREGYVYGKSPWMQPVIVPRDTVNVGSFVDVEVIDNTERHLVAKHIA